MAGEWTTVGQLDHGTVFVTRAGERLVRTNSRSPLGACQCLALTPKNGYSPGIIWGIGAEISALPIPVPTIAPNLDGTLAALLLAALSGDADALAPLRDWLAERLGDADTLAAARQDERERIARLARDEAADYEEGFCDPGYYFRRFAATILGEPPPTA